MRPASLFFLSLATLSMNVSGQQLSTGDKKINECAGARHYNLEAAGFQSLKCSVKFDFLTVSQPLPANGDPVRRLALDGKDRYNVQHRYPCEVSESAQQQAFTDPALDQDSKKPTFG